MNEILLRLGEFNEVMDEDDVTKTSSKKRCLAACENQVSLQKNILVRDLVKLFR